MNKFTISSLLILLFSIAVAVPSAIAQISGEDNDTRIEKYEDLTETEIDETDSSSSEAMESAQGVEEPTTRTEEQLEEYQSSQGTSGDYDVRRTEAFNLVSSAYRGDFEDQGINGYAVMASNYDSGDLTAEDLINAAIESGELSPSAIEDESYVQAVEFQLEALINN